MPALPRASGGRCGKERSRLTRSSWSCVLGCQSSPSAEVQPVHLPRGPLLNEHDVMVEAGVLNDAPVSQERCLRPAAINGVFPSLSLAG